jgi:hypothetical protein
MLGMRRLPIIISTMAAALLSALAVAIATPASGTDKHTDVDEFISCVRAHGLAHAPADPAAFKRSIAERLKKHGDETVTRALAACEPAATVEKPAVKDAADLLACLERHGAEITGQGILAIKRWVNEHMNDPAAQDALAACRIGGPPPEEANGEPGRAKIKPAPGDEPAKRTQTQAEPD